MTELQLSGWFVTSLIVLACSATAWLLNYHYQRVHQSGTVPLVPGYPVIGNLLDMMPSTILASLERYQHKYGHIFTLRVLTRKFFHISDAALCREVLLKRPRLFVRTHALNDMALRFKYLPYGLFHSNDEAIWARERKTASPAFSKQNVTNMSTDLLAESDHFVKRLTALSETQSSIDMLREATGFTVRVITRVAFGNTRVDYFFDPKFYEDVRVTFDTMNNAVSFPFPRWVWKLTPMYAQERLALQADQRFSEACLQVIRTARAQQAERTEEEEQRQQSHGLIDIMLRQEGATDEELLANVKTFYLAGSDTTSVTLCWATFLLTQHPAVVARMRQEIAAFYARDLQRATAQELGEALSALVYTHAVMKEAVRLYPAGPMLFLDYHRAETPLQLSNGIAIPLDHTVILNVRSCLCDERNFPQAEEFRPERWLTEDQDALGRMEHAFLGFGAGARACVGKGLALTEGVMALAALFHHFEVELQCAPEEVKVEHKFTLHPSQLPLKLAPRAGVPHS